MLIARIGTAGQDDKVVEMVRYLDLYELEGLEEWWVPTLTRFISLLMSTSLFPLLVLKSHFILAALVG